MILHFYLTKKLHISYGEPNPITYQLLENYILNISKEKYGQPNDNNSNSFK